LEKRLQRIGYLTHNWGYPSLSGRLDHHARCLRQIIDERLESGSRVHVVAHSMGSIVTRLALSLGDNSGRAVLIAPPNRGSPVARFLAPLMPSFCPVVDELSSHPNSFVNRLPPCGNVEIGCIAARFDLLVPPSCTELDGQADRVCLTATHNSLVFQRRTARLVHAFLSTGRFGSS